MQAMSRAEAKIAAASRDAVLVRVRAEPLKTGVMGVTFVRTLSGFALREYQQSHGKHGTFVVCVPREQCF